MTDIKWQGYLAYCDRYFWAMDTDLLPDNTGLMIADGYGAEIIGMGSEVRLAPARRKALAPEFARHAATRAQAAQDSGFVNGF